MNKQQVSTMKRILAPVLVLGISVSIAWYFMISAPRAHRSDPEAPIRLVETFIVEKQDVNITISGLGIIIPSRQVTLYPEVSGRIDKLLPNIMPGSFFDKDELLLSLAPEEF